MYMYKYILNTVLCASARSIKIKYNKNNGSAPHHSNNNIHKAMFNN